MLKSILAIIIMAMFSASILAAKPKKKNTDKEIHNYIQTCKLFSLEKISMHGDTLRTDYCMNADCTSYISWQFCISEIDEMKVIKDEENYAVYFKCLTGDCIKIPTIGSIYSPKNEYSLFVKTENDANILLQKLKEYKVR